MDFLYDLKMQHFQISQIQGICSTMGIEIISLSIAMRTDGMSKIKNFRAPRKSMIFVETDFYRLLRQSLLFTIFIYKRKN